MTENRYPMHACGPPRNVRRCPHTPGILETASGGFAHRSGLRVSRFIATLANVASGRATEEAHLNSSASSPHIALERWTARMGMMMRFPFATLRPAVSLGAANEAKRTHRISYCTWPFRSTRGSLSGITSSSVATRIVVMTGG